MERFDTPMEGWTPKQVKAFAAQRAHVPDAAELLEQEVLNGHVFKTIDRLSLKNDSGITNAGEQIALLQARDAFLGSSDSKSKPQGTGSGLHEFMEDLVAFVKQLENESPQQLAIQLDVLYYLGNQDKKQMAQQQSDRSKQNEQEQPPSQQVLNSAALSSSAPMRTFTEITLRRKEFNFLLKTRTSKSLFVRDCYPALAKKIFDCEKQGTEAFIVTGTPGIGKSCFAVFLVVELLRRKKTVLWQRVNDPNVMLFNGDLTCSDGDVSSFGDVLKNPDVWHIFDGPEPPKRAFGAKVVQLTSPCKKAYNHFSKITSLEKLWMPLFTIEEILRCNKACFHFEEKEVRERFDVFGGVARYVLSNEPITVVDEAINTTDVSKFAAFTGEVVIAEDTRQRILHVSVSKEFKKTHVCFASKYVEDKIVARFSVHETQKVLQFLLATSGMPNVSTVRGKMFEIFSHSVLAKGGDDIFRVRKLSGDKSEEKLSGDKSEEKLTIKELITTPAQNKVFSNLDELKSLKPGAYHRPQGKTFPAIDSLAFGKQLVVFQMTVGKNHPIQSKRLRDTINHVPVRSPKKVLFYFVVPSDIFDNFSLQPFVEGNTQSIDDARDEKNIEQWVLCMPLSN